MTERVTAAEGSYTAINDRAGQHHRADWTLLEASPRWQMEHALVTSHLAPRPHEYAERALNLLRCNPKLHLEEGLEGMVNALPPTPPSA